MAVNKVVFGNQTLVDLTSDTVEANNLLEGETAHDRSGQGITGTAKQGHVIQDQSGTDLTQRAKMQFTDGLTASDDGTGLKTKVGVNTTFTEAQTRANIASGDSLSTIFGKIKRFFTDLKTVAFTGVYSDLSGQPTNVSQFANDSGYITSSGTAANVSGTVAIANGGTGANTRLNAAKNLTNEEVTAPTHVVGLTNNWGKFGWITLANLVTALGVVNKSGDTMTGQLEIESSEQTPLKVDRSHTSTTTRRVAIDIGNDIPNGTAGSTYGEIALFGAGAFYTLFNAINSTANRNISLPDKNGTVALTSDIPYLSVITKTISINALSPNGEVFDQDYSWSDSTYNIMSIAGYQLSGDKYTRCCFNRMSFRNGASKHIYYSIRNMSTTDTTGVLTLTVQLLVMAN